MPDDSRPAQALVSTMGAKGAQASLPEPLRFRLEATVGIEPTIRVLQTPALTTWPRRLASTGAEEGI